MAFRFGNNIVRIEIENHIFRVIIDETLKEKVLSAASTVGEIKKATAEMSCETEAEKAVIEKFDGLIDDILGAGAAVKIFDGRTPDSLERTTVFIYICTEINEHINKIKENAV